MNNPKDILAAFHLEGKISEKHAEDILESITLAVDSIQKEYLRRVPYAIVHEPRKKPKMFDLGFNSALDLVRKNLKKPL